MEGDTMRRIALALLATSLLSGMAGAADMRAPVRGPAYSAPPVAYSSWTGCYLGGNVGWVGSRDRYRNEQSGSFLDPNNIFRFESNRAPLVSDITSNGSGVAGGGQIGCNYQMGWFVLGGEADIQGTSLDHTTTASFGPVFIPGGNDFAASRTVNIAEKMGWFSTVRGR